MKVKVVMKDEETMKHAAMELSGAETLIICKALLEYAEGGEWHPEVEEKIAGRMYEEIVNSLEVKK